MCVTYSAIVRDLTIKYANSSRWKCYIPRCWIPPQSPSKYSPWEAMHWCQCLVHPSKQFWNWFCGMAFRAAVVLLLSSVSSKCLPFNISFIFGNRIKSLDPSDCATHDLESTLWFTADLETLHVWYCVRFNRTARCVLHEVINRLYKAFFIHFKYYSF